MRWIALLILTVFVIGCAHHYHPDRSVSSVEEREEGKPRRGLAEPYPSMSRY
jgi:hypothetical protein